MVLKDVSGFGADFLKASFTGNCGVLSNHRIISLIRRSGDEPLLAHLS